MPLTYQPFNPAKVQPSPFANLAPLFTDVAWTKHANATASADGKTLTLVSTAAFQNSAFYLDVTPNTKYRLTLITTATAGNPLFQIGRATPVVALVSGSGTGERTLEIITPPDVRRIYVNLESDGAGTFTFSNLTLRPVQPVPQAANFQEFFKEFVINGDFSQGATGWTLHANASVVNGQLVLNATAAFQGSNQDVTVQPGMQYQFNGTATGTAGSAYARLNYYDAANALITGEDSAYVAAAGSLAKVIIAPQRAVRLSISLMSNAVGTFTFDNISLKRAMPT